MQQPESPASAGPRVSDEELAQYTMAMRLFPRPTMHIGTLPDAPEYSNTFVKVLDMACDLADSRTALAAANARIAVLEQLAQAVRDANELLMDRYYEVPHDQWDRISDMAWNLATATQDGPGAAHE